MDGEAMRQAKIAIREFRSREDAGPVAELLREAKEAADWSEEELRAMNGLTGVTAYVSERGDSVSGIVIGRKVIDEAEILNLAVRRKAQRQGEGRALVKRQLEDFRKAGVSRVFLEVRESNTGAITFYEGLGFRTVGERKDYYQEPRESAKVMELRLNKSTD